MIVLVIYPSSCDQKIENKMTQHHNLRKLLLQARLGTNGGADPKPTKEPLPEGERQASEKSVYENDFIEEDLTGHCW